MFDKIYSKAQEANSLNTKQYQNQKQNDVVNAELITPEVKIRQEVPSTKWTVIPSMPDKEIVCSEELYDIIQKLGFNIIEYGKRETPVDYDEYDPTLEYYSAISGNYKFIVKNFSDCDIDEGIFAVYNVSNMKTGIVTDYYLDLGCRNTCEVKLDNFMTLLTCDTIEEYYDKIYSEYTILEKLLSEHGYPVAENNLVFAPDRITGNYKLKDNLYVIPYRSWTDDIRVVVSNGPRWDVNSSNSYDKLAYYVSYKDRKDIDVLIENIKAFETHLSGKYGFFENDVYYKNSDVEKLFNFKTEDKNGDMLEIFNHYHVKVKSTRAWDARGYNGGNSYLNVYNGLEMAVHKHLIFNDAAQWSIGDIIDDSDIVVKYDKKLDKDNCILIIKNYQYKSDDDCYIEYDEDDYPLEKIDTPDETLKPEFLMDEVEIHAPFSEISKTLSEYIQKMAEIHNVKLELE